HPLDCPICDQGGECDLQDQAMAYGKDGSRYEENKRAVDEKYMGPLVKTIMTRCIHCTRCVRFSTEVAGVYDMGMLNRGEHAEITTLEKAIQSELSGNVIDLCPVGALTSKPYAFTARSWELTKTESVDVMDAVGSNIRVDARGNEVMRVLPRLNEDVNEEWISDKTRFACDGLLRQRLDRPYVRDDSGKLQEATWGDALRAAAAKIKASAPDKIAALAGDLCDVESMYALRGLMAAIGSSSLDCRQDGAVIDPLVRASYLFNTTIAGIEEADACLLIGTNPRWEAPIITSRLRKRWLQGNFPVGLVGPRNDITVDYTYIGAGPESLEQISAGRHEFAETLKKAERPMLILGMGALARPDGEAILAAAREIATNTGMVADGWNGFNVLHTAAARVGGLDIGFVPGDGGKDTAGILDAAASGDMEVVYLLGADEIDAAELEKSFVIYQGHHGDAGAHVADVIFPGAAYTEKNGLYVNTEGRVQSGYRAAFPPGEAREDWAILRALSGELGTPLPYDTQDALREKLREEFPGFLALDTVEPAAWGVFGKAQPLAGEPFRSPIENFYMTDPISRASTTMAKCIDELMDADEATGTDG
ncbi:MAG: NADH-quinone oxidoreductase subunit NuoG, partial [Pseudomonadota bacterium]